MKNLNIILFLIVVQFTFSQNSINWMSFEKAVSQTQSNPKLILIDVYTDWCGWCKRMDQTTFKDSVMIDFLNTNYYCVKLNAEQREDIIFGNDTMSFIQQGNKGVHELAARLLDGNLGYPAFVVLDKNFARLKIIKGFQTVEKFGPQLEKLWRSSLN